MPSIQIPLWETEAPGLNTAAPVHHPSLKAFLLDTDSQPHPCVIVFPGGGYHMKAPHEADPIAMWLNQIGLSAFVLDYRVFPYQHPYPMLDGLRAVRLVRSKAEEFDLRSDQIGIFGFSAGGHLASTVSTHWDSGNPNSTDHVERCSSRPDAQILCYPVITFYNNRHIGSMEALIGENPPDDLRRSLSSESQVNKDTPTAFIWHTANDKSVPVENSLVYASALSKYQVPFDLHIYADGPHGVGMAENDTILKTWTFLCELWLRKIGFLLE